MIFNGYLLKNKQKLEGGEKMRNKDRISIVTALLLFAFLDPVSAYLVDYETNEQVIYFVGNPVARGYLYASTYYHESSGQSEIYTWLSITGYHSLGTQYTRAVLAYSPIWFSDMYHDVWEFGKGYDWSSESWYADNPNHNPGPIILGHDTFWWIDPWRAQDKHDALTMSL